MIISYNAETGDIILTIIGGDEHVNEYLPAILVDDNPDISNRTHHIVNGELEEREVPLPYPTPPDPIFPTNEEQLAVIWQYLRTRPNSSILNPMFERLGI